MGIVYSEKSPGHTPARPSTGTAPGTWRREIGLETGLAAGIGIDLSNQGRELGPETWRAAQVVGNAPAVFEQGEPPAFAALLGLILPLQEMHEHLIEGTG